MKSRITGGEAKFLFKARILGKYDIGYYQCLDTGFIQTEEPYWLDDAYSSAIASTDIGLVRRNLDFSDKVSYIIKNHFDENGSFLDYAGGYGLFTRIMRDRGFDFYTTDKFCQNLFAEFNDLKDAPTQTGFELVTAFEVFEHLVDPLQEIGSILKYSDNLLFSTEVPPQGIQTISDWWYFVPETGQHVSFYSIASLERIAKKFERRLYTNGSSLHLFTKKELKENPFGREPFLIRKATRYLKKQYHNLSRKKTLFEIDMEKAKAATRTEK